MTGDGRRLRRMGLSAVLGFVAMTGASAADKNAGPPADSPAVTLRNLPEYRLVVFSRPTPGREAEFNDWYTHQHVGDLLKVPGVVAGQRFQMALDLSSPAGVPPYLVIFDYRTRDLGALASETIRRMQQKVFVPSDSMDYAALASAIYRPLGPAVATRTPHPAAVIAGKPIRHYIMVVLSNPTAGQEAAYNRWYDQRHIPDVLSIPGFRSAQRFVAVEPVKAPTHALPRYFVRYEFDSADPAATRDEIMARIKDGRTVISKAFDGTTSITRIYSAMMPVLYAKPYTP